MFNPTENMDNDGVYRTEIVEKKPNGEWVAALTLSDGGYMVYTRCFTWAEGIDDIFFYDYFMN